MVTWCLERSLQYFKLTLAVVVCLVAGRMQCKECRVLCVTEEIYGLPLKPKPVLSVTFLIVTGLPHGGDFTLSLKLKHNKQKRQLQTLQQLGRLYSHPHILLIHLAKVQYRNPNIAFQQFLWCH